MSKESDMFPYVKKFLEDSGHTVYSEVERGPGGKRADVVAVLGPSVTVVEMKTTLSMEVIEQAYYWIGHANYIYIAIPKRKRRISDFVHKFLRSHNIGLLEVPVGREHLLQPNMSLEYYMMCIPSRFSRMRGRGRSVDWKKILKPEHQTWLEGGSNKGGYVTDYKITIQGVKKFLSIRPKQWFTMAEILHHCETHYSSPKNSLAKALIEFENDWCETKKEGNRRMFRYKGGS